MSSTKFKKLKNVLGRKGAVVYGENRMAVRSAAGYAADAAGGGVSAVRWGAV